MKKIIVVGLILIIGLFILGGCSSDDVESENQQENQERTSPEPQQNQQEVGSDIPSPPALPEE